MNPQDLLYTNQFQNTNVISNKNLIEHSKNFKQYQKHIHKIRHPIEEYVTKDTRHKDEINVDKKKAHLAPSSSNSNIKPIFSSAVSDIVENKYRKSTRTAVSIYSNDRDKTKYIAPNNYIINLGKDFTNIYKIKLIDIDVPAIIPPVNHRNNMIKWIYPTYDVIDTCKYTILPFNPIPEIPSSSDLYISSALDNEFTTSIPEGFYTTTSLSDELKNNMNTVLFNQGTQIDPLYITHNYDININPHKSITSIINRVDNIYISGIQTIKQTNLDNRISCYIIVNEKLDDKHLYNPIIISGIPFTNNGIFDMLNLTELYDSSIVPPNKHFSNYNNTHEPVYTEYYKYSVTIGTDSFPKYDNSVYLYPSQNDYIVFDKQLGAVLTELKYYKWHDFTNGVHRPVIGKARAFALKNKFDNRKALQLNPAYTTDVSCVDPIISILSILGWNISEYKTDIIDEEHPFKFVHKNTDTKLSNLLDIQLLQTGDYIFKSVPFIFLKISFPTLPDDICAGQLVRSTSNISSKLSTKYYYPVLHEKLDSNTKQYSQNTCFPNDTKCIVDNYIKDSDMTYDILEMNDRHLFAKINISSIQGTSYNIHNYKYEYLFYDNPLNNINQLKIELLSPDGRILELNQDHNITLEIMESIDVLKETLFDTKHNNTVTTGVMLN